MAYFQSAGAAGFLPDDFESLLLVDDDVDRLLDRLAAWKPPRSERWLRTGDA